MLAIKRYVRKPTIASAVQWSGKLNDLETIDVLLKPCNSPIAILGNGSIFIGHFKVKVGDYIVKDETGVQVYDPETFKLLYNEVEGGKNE